MKKRVTNLSRLKSLVAHTFLETVAMRKPLLAFAQHERPGKRVPNRMKATLDRPFFKVGLVLCIVLMGAVPAAADGTIYAVIYLANNTTQTFQIPFSGAHTPQVWGTQGNTLDFAAGGEYVVMPDGSPSRSLGPHKTMIFGTKSSGGFLATTGTGGSLSIPSANATITWSAPWSMFNGLGGGCDGEVNTNSGSAFLLPITITGGATGSGNNTCSFVFVINGQNGNVQQPQFESFHELNVDPNHILVLGTDRKLWLEQAPFGTVPPARRQVDANVQDFQELDIQDILVRGTDSKLWLEHAPFGNVPPSRDQVDGNVQGFQAVDKDNAFVLGTDAKLWLEHAPFGNVPPTREQVDDSVHTFRAFYGQTLALVLGFDGNLWLEYPPFGKVPPKRDQIDGHVQAFEAVGDHDENDIFVLGTDGNLWLEHAPFGKVPPTRQQVDGNVRSFRVLDTLDFVWVLGTDGKLWLEQGPFGKVPPKRQQIDGNVQDFQPLDLNTILVLGTDHSLWLEHAPFGHVPPKRDAVDRNVL